MKRLLLTLAIAMCSLGASAQEWIDIGLSARADYQHDWNHDDSEENGFKGKYLNLDINGKISDNFSFNLRQRLNKAPTSENPFKATDWVYLTYTKSQWSISAGKLIYEMGGYEYDKAPIDIYFASVFWNNIACYQFGVSGSYTTLDGNHMLKAQITQSPYANNTENWLSYNLLWAGAMGPLQTRYSINFAEYRPGKFVNHIILGNSLDLGKVIVEADLYHRAEMGDYSLFKNFTLVGKVTYNISQRFSLFGKVIYDRNNEDFDYDQGVATATEFTRLGGGVEFFPIKGKKNVRLHLNTYYSHGDNPHPTNPIRPNCLITDIGLTWKVSLLKR